MFSKPSSTVHVQYINKWRDWIANNTHLSRQVFFDMLGTEWDYFLDSIDHKNPPLHTTTGSKKIRAMYFKPGKHYYIVNLMEQTNMNMWISAMEALVSINELLNLVAENGLAFYCRFGWHKYLFQGGACGEVLEVNVLCIGTSLNG